MLTKVRNGALTFRDVKNEDRSGYVYENKWGVDDKMSCKNHLPLNENAGIGR